LTVDLSITRRFCTLQKIIIVMSEQAVLKLPPAVADTAHRFVQLIRGHERSFVFATILAVASASWAVPNYQAYVALGRGAIENSFVAWTVATLAKPFGRETTGTEAYDRDANKESWLRPRGPGAGAGAHAADTQDAPLIPKRGRPRPRTGWHFMPHRQVEQLPPSEAIKASLEREFRAILADNPDLVEVQTSFWERHGDALVIHPSIATPHAVAVAARREIAHVHRVKDYSMHVVLAPADCKIVIEQGWGERHPLAGVVLPKEYMFVYAPQTEEDVAVAGTIMRAAVGYMTGSWGVE